MIVMYFVLFFFFKQKTVYELRIRDGSSDVCSSDLVRMMGTSRPGVSVRRGLLGAPPVSWMIGLPVRLVIDSLARVSVRIGASACSLSRAITARGSLGASFRLSMVPM